MQNPKLAGSNLIDCIPQTGLCPNNCLACYYNSDGFYHKPLALVRLPNRTKDSPLIPTLEEAQGKIVRVNSGHDSNIEKDLVLSVTAQYPHKFYNTSIPNFDFPAPVVFTCNPRDNKWIRPKSVDNLMMVRFRVSTWNVDICDEAASFFTSKGVPYVRKPHQRLRLMVLTFMRYSNIADVKYPQHYERRKNILNIYYQIKLQFKEEIEARYANNPLVVTCGGKTGYCCDCGNCERFYWLKQKKVYHRSKGG